MTSTQQTELILTSDINIHRELQFELNLLLESLTISCFLSFRFVMMGSFFLLVFGGFGLIYLTDVLDLRILTPMVRFPEFPRRN